jgi:two-component system sensor histidine kinase UhpB
VRGGSGDHMDLDERLARLESVLAEMDVGLYSVSLDLARVFHVNRAAERIYGRTAQEFLANPRLWLEVIEPGEEAYIGDPLAEVLATGSARHIYRIVRSDGERRWVLDQTHRVPASDDAPARIDCVLTDITRRMSIEKELRALPEHILRAQERERRNLACELHDGAIQDLASLKLCLSELQLVAANERQGVADAAFRQIDAVIGGLRDLVTGLRPAMLDDLGLVPTLRSYIARRADEAGIEAFVSVDLPDCRLMPDIETHCYRIVQEAVANAIAHAQAQRLFVSVCRMGASLELCVRDDGRGFDVEWGRLAGASRRHFGLAVMAERAGCMGGRLEIHSAPGAGTEIVARLPYRERGTSLG